MRAWSHISLWPIPPVQSDPYALLHWFAMPIEWNGILIYRTPHIAGVVVAAAGKVVAISKLQGWLGSVQKSDKA